MGEETDKDRFWPPSRREVIGVMIFWLVFIAIAIIVGIRGLLRKLNY